MPLQAGIVGLPNVGKSTLFNAITEAGADMENYPFCTIDPNVGVVEVPDDRLPRLADVLDPEEVLPTTVEFVDIAGLVAGASEGEGLGNQFLGHIREVDAICHVVRCFEGGEVAHVEGSVDPLRDIDTIATELLLADLETVSDRLQKAERRAKSQDPDDLLAARTYRRLKGSLEAGRPVRTLNFDDPEQPLIDELHLLTAKPILYVANVGESEAADADSPHAGAVAERAAEEGAGWLAVSAALEAELAELDADDQHRFLADLGLDDSGLNRLIRAAYRLLDLLTFFTIESNKVQAWTTPRGSRAPAAAGTIHSDFERGFIRAEVIPWEDLVDCGSYARARDQGLVRVEGKDYVMQDGDVAQFRFNV